MRLHLSLISLLALTASLAACNRDAASSPPPQTAAPGAASLPADKQPAPTSGRIVPGRLTAQAFTAGNAPLHTIQFTVASHVFTHIPGQADLVTDLPAGMTGAYRFTNGAVKARLNAPGAAFSDGRARIAVYSQTGNNIQGGVVFADTLQTDPLVPAGAVGAMFQGLSGVSTNPQKPFLKQLPGEWSTQASQPGVTTSTSARPAGQTGPDYLTAQKSATTANQGTLSTTQYFDPAIGAMTRQTSTVDSANARAVANTTVQYMSPTDQPDLLIPSQILSTQSVTSKRPGENAINMDQQTDYSNVQINALPDAYFDIGGL